LEEWAARGREGGREGGLEEGQGVYGFAEENEFSGQGEAFAQG
jgi:hypothetical protein